MRAHTKKASGAPLPHCRCRTIHTFAGQQTCQQQMQKPNGEPSQKLCLQLEEMRKNEDPRLSFSTPEFKEAQRIFTDGLKVLRPSAIVIAMPL